MPKLAFLQMKIKPWLLSHSNTACKCSRWSSRFMEVTKTSSMHTKMNGSPWKTPFINLWKDSPNIILRNSNKLKGGFIAILCISFGWTRIWWYPQIRSILLTMVVMAIPRQNPEDEVWRTGLRPSRSWVFCNVHMASTCCLLLAACGREMLAQWKMNDPHVFQVGNLPWHGQAQISQPQVGIMWNTPWAGIGTHTEENRKEKNPDSPEEVVNRGELRTPGTKKHLLDMWPEEICPQDGSLNIHKEQCREGMVAKTM